MRMRTLNARSQSNMMQVELEATLDKGLMFMPAGIAGFETCNRDKGQLLQDVDLGGTVVYSIPELQIVLTVNEFGMGMSTHVLLQSMY